MDATPDAISPPTQPPLELEDELCFLVGPGRGEGVARSH
jgi:hypothetical protein